MVPYTKKYRTFCNTMEQDKDNSANVIVFYFAYEIYPLCAQYIGLQPVRIL